MQPTGASNSGISATNNGSDSEGSTGSDAGTGSSSGGTTTSTTTDSTSSSGPTSDPTGNPTSDPTSDPTTNDPTSDSDSDTSDPECGAIEEESEIAPIPADIIFAIDTSGSMEVEKTSVENNMNAFSTQIINSGVDAHVVLIANDEMCIDAPLGSGNCPTDTNEDGGYLHVMQGVGSNDALAKIISTHPQYVDFLRENSIKHVVVVSDDDSDLNANAFHQQFQALGPEYEDYKFHAIVGEFDAGDVVECIANPICCAFIASAGEEYMDLVALTGGLLGDLCDQEFGPIFNELSTQVVDNSPLPCQFDIPEPMGQNLDFDKVNVEIDVANNPVVIPKVEGMAGCNDVEDGWYYDDENDPQQIILCPDTCTKVQGDEGAKIAVSFGCETLIPE